MDIDTRLDLRDEILDYNKENLKKITYLLLKRLLKDIPKENFIKLKLYDIYNSNEEIKSAFLEKLKHLRDKIPRNLSKKSNKYILVFDDNIQIDIEEILLTLNNKKLCDFFNLSFNDLMDMIDETAQANKNNKIHISLRRCILMKYYTDNDLLHSLIYEIIDKDKERFSKCMSLIQSKKREHGDKTFTKTDCNEILSRFTKEELKDVFCKLSQLYNCDNLKPDILIYINSSIQKLDDNELNILIIKYKDIINEILGIDDFNPSTIVDIHYKIKNYFDNDECIQLLCMLNIDELNEFIKISNQYKTGGRIRIKKVIRKY